MAVHLKKGDTIRCSDPDDLIKVMTDLQEAGVWTDFLYEKDGVKGYWLIVTKIEKEK